jgi:selenocysteine-specific elongation factor
MKAGSKARDPATGRLMHIIVGTAGHIDHGKTSLVKALTGTDPDRLKEEKARGITIDLGFASLALDGGTTLGFIDVPGHERFVKNMLAGVGGIDLVMLVVAADESVMPQTREHLDICSLLGLRHGLTVLTKIDAADPELVDLAEVEVHEFLKGSFLEHAPVLRVSAVTGEGIPRLVETLSTLARGTPARDDSLLFRLPIDRAFSMKGFGTVVSGTLTAGRIRKDEEIELLPDGRSARVRGIQVHGRAVDEARAGQRTALNLPRVDLADVERGMIAVPPGVFRSASNFDVYLELLPSAPAPIVRRRRIRFHIGTAELLGYAVLLGEETLEPGGSTFAQILLERPTFALPGDRFIVRQYSPMTTIGGGEILEAGSRRHRRSERAVVERLARVKDAPLDRRVLDYVEEADVRSIDTDGLVARLGVTGDQARDAVLALAREGRAHISSDNPLVASSVAAFDRISRGMREAVRRFHDEDPLQPGMTREELKARLPRDVSALLFRSALDALVAARELAVDHDLVRASERTVTLGIGEVRIREALEARLRSAALQPPAIDELIGSVEADPQVARKILQLMLKENAVVKVAEGTFVDRGALERLVEDVKALKAKSDRLGVKEFKELTGLSRKYAMPLLEYLDGRRVTRRVGDERLIL